MSNTDTTLEERLRRAIDLYYVNDEDDTHGKLVRRFEEILSQELSKKDEELENIKQSLLVWAGYHRGRWIAEPAMPRFHEIIDKLDALLKEGGAIYEYISEAGRLENRKRSAL